MKEKRNFCLEIVVFALLVLSSPVRGDEADQAIQQMKSKETSVRETAVWNLAVKSKQSKKILQALIEALKDESAFVRLQAANGLQFYGAEAKVAVPALLDVIEDPDKDVRSMAFTALVEIGLDSADVVLQIAKHLNESDSSIRIKATRLLGTLCNKDKKAVAYLRNGLADQEVLVRLVAAEAILRIRPYSKSAQSVLQAGVIDKNRGARAQAILSVNEGLLSKELTIEALRSALKDTDYENRAMAISGLGKLGKDAKPCLPDLVKMMNEDKSVPPVVTAMTVLRIEPANPEAIKVLTSSVPFLIATLNGEQKTERRFAVDALALLVSHSSKAREALELSRNDGDPTIREAVRLALRQK